jgi:HD-GYP domain-containing protein (c-di-GMP phosphodiesterase class II)
MTADANDRPNDTPLYNSRIILPYIQLLRKKYPYVDSIQLLSRSGMKPYEVNDQGHWFSQKQIDRFYDEIVKLTGNPGIAREAGQYAASPETVGVMWQYVLGLLSPTSAYEKIGKTSANFTRSSRFESRKLSPNKFEIVVTPHPHVSEKPFQCENRKGFFEAILTLFNNKIPEIEHPECVFKGDKSCRYILSWERSFTDSFRLMKNYLFVLFSLTILLAAVFMPLQITGYTAAVLMSVFFGLSYFNEMLNKNYLNSTLSKIRNISENLVEQIDLNYNNALVTREIGQVVNRHYVIDNVLSEIVRILEKRLDYDRGVILLASKDKTTLSFKAGYGYTSQQYQFLKNIRFSLNNPKSKGVFVMSFKRQKPFLVNDINEIEETLSRRSLEFADRIGAQAFICCPVICDNESLGILAVDNIKDKRMLVQSDISLLMGISNVIGISIRHTEHLEAREKQLKSVLQVMVSTIDARDPITSGHSERVSEFSVGICRELDLDREYTEMVRVAALLHDYGKIGIPDSLLKKSEIFTENEMEHIKCHAEKTTEILEKIEFEGYLKEVPYVAGAHHEKLDGSGYPNGLKADEIPLGARIIAVADYFEALTASRYYKIPMAPEKAIELLIQNSGTHFEGAIVEAFIRYYYSSYSSSNEVVHAPHERTSVHT